MSDFIYRFEGIKIQDGWQHPLDHKLVISRVKWLDSQSDEKLAALKITKHDKPTKPAHDKYYQKAVEQPSGEYVIEDLPLGDVKAKRKAEINAEKRQRQVAGFQFKRKMFDCHRDAILDITQASIAAQYAIDNDIEYNEAWTLQDNSEMVLSAADVLEMQLALTGHGREIHLQAKALKAQVDLCQNGAAVKAVEWPEA